MITISLPKPISTNRTRKIDWAGYRRHKEWIRLAELMLFEQWRDIRKAKITGRFSLTIVMPESVRQDLDNLKVVPDLLKRMGLILDDSPKYMREFIVRISDDVKEGCVAILTPL